jgi:Uncharacterized conserved protein
MAEIDDILPQGITETIVTTMSADGRPNAAPMGIVRQGDRMLIRMFPGSITFGNVSETGHLVANIVTDPMVFVVSAFEDLDSSYFVAQRDMPPTIRDTYAWVYFKAEVDGTVRLTPLKSEVLQRKVPSFSRGFAAVIDAAVTGTRLRFLGDEGKKRIHEDDVLVGKCGTPRDIEAMSRLRQILGL